MGDKELEREILREVCLETAVDTIKSTVRYMPSGGSLADSIVEVLREIVDIAQGALDAHS